MWLVSALLKFGAFILGLLAIGTLLYQWSVFCWWLAAIVWQLDWSGSWWQFPPLYIAGLAVILLGWLFIGQLLIAVPTLLINGVFGIIEDCQWRKRSDVYIGKARMNKGALIGLLVDVSGSMTQSIGDRSGQAVSRLESVRTSIRRFADQLSEQNKRAVADATSAIDIFALGFGFDNPLAKLCGSSAVRDLLTRSDVRNGIVSANDLSENWSRYEANILSMALDMFGSTPLMAALKEADARLSDQRSVSYGWGSWLLIVSDGAPTDASPAEICNLADRMRRGGTTIVSCFVAGDDVAGHRRLFAQPASGWPSEALMMFDCASVIDETSAMHAYFREMGWVVDAGGRLFAQVNHSELLAEFIGAMAAIAGGPAPLQVAQRPAQPTMPSETAQIDVFLSYAREDYFRAKHLVDKLTADGISVWWDQSLRAGERYDDQLQAMLDRARAAIVIWSPNSIASDWVKYEARRAHSSKKLIPICVDELDVDGIPPPYPAVLHVIGFDDYAHLLVSLRELGISPRR